MVKKVFLVLAMVMVLTSLIAPVAMATPTPLEDALTFSVDLSELGSGIAASLTSLTPVC